MLIFIFCSHIILRINKHFDMWVVKFCWCVIFEKNEAWMHYKMRRSDKNSVYAYQSKWYIIFLYLIKSLILKLLIYIISKYFKQSFYKFQSIKILIFTNGIFDRQDAKVILVKMQNMLYEISRYMRSQLPK